MEVKFDVQMTTSKLYDFNLQHSYKKPVSIMATALGVVFIFLFARYLTWYYLVAGILLIVYLPISLLRSSFMKVKMIDFFKEPVSYLLNDEGITVSAQGEEQTIPWSDCVKAIEVPLVPAPTFLNIRLCQNGWSYYPFLFLQCFQCQLYCLYFVPQLQLSDWHWRQH